MSTRTCTVVRPDTCRRAPLCTRLTGVRRIALALLLAASFRGTSESAFETVPQAPWMNAGACCTLFPACAATQFENPASIALLEGWSASASASRPFGLPRLDRASAAASLPWRDWAFGAGIIASGDREYSEWTLTATASRRVIPGLAGGVSASTHRLSIDGYGAASGFSADAGLVARPMDGILAGASVRGFIRSRLGESGDPSVPRSFSIAAGVAPVSRLRISASLSISEGLDPESSLMLGYAPSSALSLGLGFVSDPARFSFSFSIGTGLLEFLYGLGFHPSLGETHSAGIAFGRAGHVPVPATRAPVTVEEPDPEALIGINTAGMEELMLLPGIGPAKAESIIGYRSEHGPFTTLEQLLDVPGIGPTLFEAIRSRLVVD